MNEELAMKGNPQVIEQLNDLLTGELTSIDQYFAHSRMYHDFGLNKLYERLSHEMLEEQTHADKLIQRILFLDGKPDLARRNELKIGGDVAEMLKNDLQLEYQVIDHLRKVMLFCESVSDFVSRDILLSLLKDTEEDHAYWLETQLGLIERIGLANYIQSQI